MKDTSAMVTIYVRWAGRQFEQGYEIFQPSTGKWHPVPMEDVQAFLEDGGIVYLNPEHIPGKIKP